MKKLLRNRRWRDPRLAVRAALGVLLLANLVMAALAFKPWARSAAELDQEVASLQRQIRERQGALEKLRALVSKIESARAAGDDFLGSHFMNRRTASSTMVAELLSIAQKAGIKQKEVSFLFEPIEGSEDMSLITVNADYEGTFADLMQFVNLLDHSEKFLIVESMQAAPQQSGLTLNISMRLNGFLREDAGREAALASGQQALEAQP
jgi:type IV pilus assembly protein PilO